MKRGAFPQVSIYIQIYVHRNTRVYIWLMGETSCHNLVNIYCILSMHKCFEVVSVCTFKWMKHL